jgi:malate dehydrogenase (oxaloacetate-decarboxylating)
VREISSRVALAVAREAQRTGLADGIGLDQLEQCLREKMWQPNYVPLRLAGS